MNDIVKSALLFTLFLFFAVVTIASAAPANWSTISDRIHTASASDSVYVVQQGDTYYSLSRRFNIPLDSLQKWNGSELQIGQKLYLVNQKNFQAGTEVATSTAPSEVKEHSVATPYTISSTESARPKESNSASVAAAPRIAEYKTKQRVLVIPFDPYLYFSDSDHEIARQSKIPSQNVRYVFRSKLNAMLAPAGYETIHLLGGVYRDSVSELSRVYKSLDYNYQDNKKSKYNHEPKQDNKDTGVGLEWVQRQKEKLGIKSKPVNVPVAQDDSKHFGVTVKDPEFFSYFNNQYDVDYYVFINQFEVKTVYENCLDRAAQNYERNFLVHYSIYDSKGELVSGNRLKVPYESNINDVQRIVNDNMPNMAKRVLADLPQAR